MCSPTMRMTMSVALPGPNGTTTLTGFDGYLSCAVAAPTMARQQAANARMPNRFMRSSTSCDPAWLLWPAALVYDPSS